MRFPILRHRLGGLSVFALAMAYLEAVVVIYLRYYWYGEHPLDIFPLPRITGMDLSVELGRETATVLMIFIVAALSMRERPQVFAAFVYVFGLWDILYYAWLKLLLGWPRDWGDWDVLFLIPWPWLGPWISAAAIAVLFVCWGGWVLGRQATPRFGPAALGLFLAGVMLCLAAFLQPAAHLVHLGPEALRGFRPGAFHWCTFGAGYVLLAAGLLWAMRRPRRTSDSVPRHPRRVANATSAIASGGRSPTGRHGEPSNGTAPPRASLNCDVTGLRRTVTRARPNASVPRATRLYIHRAVLDSSEETPITY
jgi:hypothetical protein